VSGRKIRETQGYRPLSRAAIVIRKCPSYASGLTLTPASQAKTRVKFHEMSTVTCFGTLEAKLSTGTKKSA
jgi:hypothetical protein